MASAAGMTSVGLLFLFSFSAILFLFLVLQAPAAPGLLAALDRFLDGRGVMELATRRNMILLCHAILLIILRDAGLLGAPASRRSRSQSPLGEAAANVAVTAAGPEIACSAASARPHAIRSAVVAHAAHSAVPVPARPHATRSTVEWRRRRPRNRAVVAPMHEHDAADRVAECRPASEAAATWTAPVLTTGPPAQAPEEAAAAVATKQIVLAESPRSDDDGDDLFDRHDRAAVVEPLEHPTAIADDGETDCDDRRVIVIADDDDTAREQQTAAMDMELADDRTFEEFIESQRRQMRQESLRLVRSGYHDQAIAACY